MSSAPSRTLRRVHWVRGGHSRRGALVSLADRLGSGRGRDGVIHCLDRASKPSHGPSRNHGRHFLDHAAHIPSRTVSSRLSHWPIWFQLANVRFTNFHSNAFNNLRQRNVRTLTGIEPRKALDARTRTKGCAGERPVRCDCYDSPLNVRSVLRAAFRLLTRDSNRLL